MKEVAMTSTQAVKPRSARRDRIRLIVAGAAVVLAGAGVLAGCATLGPALAAPVATSVNGPLPVVSVKSDPVVEAVELPAEGASAPAALPDFSASISAEAVAEVAPVVHAAPVEAAPAEGSDEIDAEYAGESDRAPAAESAPVAPSSNGGSGIDFHYTLDGYASTTPGGQAMIDRCTGGVTEMGSYSTEDDAPRTFALHSHCGGDAVTFAETGSIVAIGGSVYELGPIVARLSMYSNSSSDIPRGSDALWQSCYNGASDMAFRSLTLIG